MRMNGMNVKRYWVSRATAGIIGVVFISAGIIKGLDIELFIRQIKYYGIIDHRILLVACAWSLISLEFALGLALMVYYRPKIILAVTGALMILFILVTARAWMAGTLEDCGCFGTLLKRSPGTAIIEDFLLLGGVCLAWAAYQQNSNPERRLKWVIPAIGCVVGLIIPLASGFSLFGLSNAHVENNDLDLTNIQVLAPGSIDLRNGTHLIVIMSTGCAHCQDAVAELNCMVEDNELFDVVSLCADCEEDRNRFVEEFKPVYPVAQIEEDDFWKLIGQGEVPRFILVQNSKIQKVWDENVPDWETIMKVLHS
ncbi:MAG: hypothetical protein U9N83_19520 [Thermodesulfobacteriota bacterium]|nr:hypothetical protein [Thermodesulfobacteriota bacterium]